MRAQSSANGRAAAARCTRTMLHEPDCEILSFYLVACSAPNGLAGRLGPTFMRQGVNGVAAHRSTTLQALSGGGQGVFLDSASTDLIPIFTLPHVTEPRLLARHESVRLLRR